MGFKGNLILVINRKVIKKLCLASLILFLISLKSYCNDFCLEVLLEPLLEFGGGFIFLFLFCFVSVVCFFFFPLYPRSINAIIFFVQKKSFLV